MDVNTEFKRIWLCRMFIVGAVALVLTVYGCLPALSKTPIVYQYNWYAVPWMNDAFLQLIDAFNKSQKDIEVKGICVPGTYEKLLASIAGGVAPDIVHFETSAVIEWAAKGLLMPLDDLFTPDELRKQFVPADAAEVILDGHVWGIPGYTNVGGLFWNKDILEEVGIDSDNPVPQFRDLDTVAAKCLKTDASGRFTRIGFVPWMDFFYPAAWFWTFGGEIYDPVRKRPTLDRIENIKAWEWVQDWAARYPPGRMNLNTMGLSGYSAYFLSGSLAMITKADNFVAEIRKYVPELNYATGEVPHPPGGRNGTWGGGIGHIIPKGCKHPREAKVFLKWLSSEGQRMLYKSLSQLPTNLSVLDEVISDIPKGDQRIPLLRQMKMRNPRPPLWAKVITRLLNVQSSDILTLKKNPQEVLSNLQREFLPLYEEVFGKQ